MSKKVPLASGCFMLLFLSFWSACTLLIDYAVTRDLWRQWRTSTYLETVGTVTLSKVDVHNHSEGMSYVSVIHYDYTVDNELYSGKIYKLSGWHDWGVERSARRLIKEHPVGKTVAVYYCPGHPEQAVLCKGLEMQDSILPLMLTVFNGVMLIGIYVLLKNTCRRFFRNEKYWFRDFPIQDDGITLCLRISFHDLIPATIIGTLPAAFIAMLFFFLFDQGDIALLIGWGCFFLGGLLGFCLAIHWNRSDRYVLTVDRSCNVLILPRQPDKMPGPVVPFNAIKNLTLSQKPDKWQTTVWGIPVSSSDERENHILTLYYRIGTETLSAIVASNHNRVQASWCFVDEVEELTELKSWILRETASGFF